MIEEKQQAVDEAVKHLMEAKIAAHSTELTARLASARREVLENKGQSGGEWRHMVSRWGVGAALAASLFVAIGVQFVAGPLNTAGDSGAMAGEPELVVAEVDVEFLQDLDFYYWYGEEVGTEL